MRGRKPKPTAIKQLDGNPGKRPLNDREPKPEPAMPPRPTGLPPEARKAWDRLAPALHRCGILTAIDGDGLESYCRLYATTRECWRKVKATGGPITVDEEGAIATNPAVREARQLELMLHRLRSELGLNATSRSRIQVEPAQSEEDLEAFLKFPA